MHLGCDHAGLDLKDHLTAWLTEHGYEPVDHGPFVYDALDDYPVFCLRAAEGVADRRRGSLGVVIGGSGNGEQIAANKVTGIRCALVWSEETAVLARQHNDAQVVAVGGRMHTVEEMTRFVEVFLATPFSERGAARAPDRHARRLRAHRRAAAAAGSARRHRATMPEGHTLHRLAARRWTPPSAGGAVRVSSPQGRFAESAALVDGQVLRRRRGRPASTCSCELRGRPRRPRPPRPDRPASTCTPTSPRYPLPVGQVRLRLATADGTPAAYADLRGAIVCDLVTRPGATR